MNMISCLFLFRTAGLESHNFSLRPRQSLLLETLLIHTFDCRVLCKVQRGNVLKICHGRKDDKCPYLDEGKEDRLCHVQWILDLSDNWRVPAKIWQFENVGSTINTN